MRGRVTTKHRSNAIGLLVGLLMIGIGYANNGPSLDPSLTTVQAATVPEGFGADTVGGDQGNVCHVTTLDDQFLNDPLLGWGSGPPGTLRYCTFDALVRPCNNPSCGTKVVFDVAGTIRLTRKLLINASYVTIDGSDAPAPGITLDGTHIEFFQPAIQIRSNHDVIVKHIRIHKYGNYEWEAGMSDGLDLINTHNVLIDHVSVYNPGDEAMTIGSGTNAGIPSGYTHDITVQHSIFAYTYTGTHPTTSGIMIEYDPINNVSLHHNYIYNFKRRSPKFGTGGHYDFRNNVIAHADGWGDEGGTRLIADQGVNATGNILKNVYNANYGTAILVEDNDPWHISGNMYNGDASFDDGLSSHAEYTNVPAIMTLEVTEVQGHVFGCAGAFPRDGADQNLVGPPSQECGAPAPDSICGDGLVDSGESCDDGNTTSCDGCSYPGCATETLSTWYLDADGDNRGDPTQTTLAYCIPIGYESNSLDCDDGDPQVYGGDGAPQELCDNGKDDDCAGGDALCGGGTDLTYEISASADDAGRQARGKFELHGWLRATAGNDYDRWSSGMRFTNVAIPQGALISRASLEVSTRLYGGNPVDDANVELYAEDVDNADAFSSSGNFASRVQTTASVSWVQKDMGAGPVRSPDISAVIQEVVNRPGWQSGNDLVILVKGHSGTGGVFEMHSIDTDSAKKPKLHITINGGGGCSPDCTAPLCGQPDGCGNPCPTTDRDCNGVCGGSAVEDCAGECDGNAAVGCDNICSLSPAVFDECNVCGGDGSSCSGGSYDVLSDFGQPCRYACRDAGFAFDCDANATDANTIGGCPAGYEAKSVAGECGDINWNNCDRDHYAWQLLCRCID